jgi:hypothetical protein
MDTTIATAVSGLSNMQFADLHYVTFTDFDEHEVLLSFRIQQQIFLQNFENLFACQGVVSHSTLSQHEAVCMTGHQPIGNFDHQ